ncbi:hypothetical protein TrispH2_008067 [Trichoplax sp. H2]|nr:hypothetical protein TrispH2_008067 [Trichoplax sp. H2]|eukprot:RDD40816.1 hypothetical protein TrispH2_008067 [Trichoplax sp. H2]
MAANVNVQLGIQCDIQSRLLAQALLVIVPNDTNQRGIIRLSECIYLHPISINHVTLGKECRLFFNKPPKGTLRSGPTGLSLFT